jgi:hypothetical protein
MLISICLHVCISTTLVLNAYGGQKRVSDPLDPEFQMVLSHTVDAGNRIQVLEKPVFFATSPSISPAQRKHVLKHGGASFSISTWETGRSLPKFKTSLVYIASFKLSRALYNKNLSKQENRASISDLAIRSAHCSLRGLGHSYPHITRFPGELSAQPRVIHQGPSTLKQADTIIHLGCCPCPRCCTMKGLSLPGQSAAP